MKKINGINIARINNAAHTMFVHEVITAAEENERLAKETGEKIAAIKAALAEERSYMGRSRKSFLTDSIAAADMARDQLYKAYRRCVSAYTRMPDKEIADAAATLAQHLKSYKLDTASNLMEESGAMHRFLATLTERHADKLEKLSLTAMVEAMQKQTDLVMKYYSDRTSEMAKLEHGAMKRAKKRTSELYREYVEIVNALAIINGDSDYAKFIDYVNQVIKRFKQETLK